LEGGVLRGRASRDVTPGAPEIKATKTHQERDVPLGAATVRWLRAHRAAMIERALRVGASIPADAFVLSDAPDSSTSLRPDLLTKAWARARMRTGVSGVTVLELRHWAATQMIDAGLDPVVVAAILGHADASTTRRYYAAATDRARREAGEVLGDA